MTVKLEWAYNGHQIGEEISVSASEEKRLIEGGYATKVEKEESKSKPQRKAGDKDES